MSRTINRVELLGRVGADPEMRYSQGGTAVTTLRLATDRRRQNGDTEADWHSVVCWGKQAEAVAEYVKKGNRLFVAGSLAQNTLRDGGRPAPSPHGGARPGGRLPRLQRATAAPGSGSESGSRGRSPAHSRRLPAPRPSSPSQPPPPATRGRITGPLPSGEAAPPSFRPVRSPAPPPNTRRRTPTCQTQPRAKNSPA